MSADVVTNAIGWVGVAISYIVSFPQIILMLRTKNSSGISALTYGLLFATDVCYLIRAIYIDEPVFIAGKLWASTIVGIQLCLILHYRARAARLAARQTHLLGSDPVREKSGILCSGSDPQHNGHTNGHSNGHSTAQELSSRQLYLNL